MTSRFQTLLSISTCAATQRRCQHERSDDPPGHGRREGVRPAGSHTYPLHLCRRSRLLYFNTPSVPPQYPLIKTSVPPHSPIHSPLSTSHTPQSTLSVYPLSLLSYPLLTPQYPSATPSAQHSLHACTPPPPASSTISPSLSKE